MPGAYYLATVHRAANTDDPKTLARWWRPSGGSTCRLCGHCTRGRERRLKAAGVALPANLRAV